MGHVAEHAMKLLGLPDSVLSEKSLDQENKLRLANCYPDF